MPIKRIQSEATGKIHRIEFDEENPSDELIQSAVDEADAPFLNETQKLNPLAEREAQITQVQEEAAKPLMSKAGNMALGVPKYLLDTVVKGAPALAKLQRDPFVKLAQGDLRGTAKAAAAVPATVLEAAGRTGQDILGLGQQVIGKTMDEPKEMIQAGALNQILPGAGLLYLMRSRNLSKDEAEKTLERQEASQNLQKERDAGVVKSVSGLANKDAAELLSLVADPEAVGAVVAAKTGLKAAKAVTPALEKAGLKKTIADIATDTLKPTGEASKRNLDLAIESGQLESTLQEVKAVGSPKDLPSFIKVGEKAADGLENQTSKFVKENANEVINGNTAANRMREIVNNNITLKERNPEVIDRVLKNAESVDRELPLNEAFQRLREINERSRSYFKRSRDGQATLLDDFEYAADQEMRKELSKQFDGVVTKKTGNSDNFFRKWGLLGDTLNSAQKRLVDLKTSRRTEVSKGYLPTLASKFELAHPLRSLGEPLRYLRGGELGRINRNVEKLFKKLPAKPRKMTPVERELFLKRELAAPDDAIPELQE